MKKSTFYREGFSGWSQPEFGQVSPAAHQPGIGHAYGEQLERSRPLLCPKNDWWLLVETQQR